MFMSVMVQIFCMTWKTHENICSIIRMKNIHSLFYITAKWIFFSKTKLTLFSQIHFLGTAGNCGLTHGYTVRVTWICFTHSQLHLGMARSYLRILVPKKATVQACNSTNAWDQKCTANHWTVQINNVTWHSMNQSRNKDLFSCKTQKLIL